MAVLRECFRFRALHTRRPRKFCFNADRKPQGARSSFVETRQQENARDRVLSAPLVSEAMKEMRRQKRNPCHWTVQALIKSIKFTSHDIVLIVFVPTKKTSPNRPSNGKFMVVLRDYSRFRALHTRRPGKFCWNVDRKPS